MIKKLASVFEGFIDPYPEVAPRFNSKNLFDFIWVCSDGLKKYIGAMTVLTMLFGTVEAFIFFYLGEVVDRLSVISPNEIWNECGLSLIFLATLLLFSPFILSLLTLFKFQTLQGNFPMRLRWNFHRLMLSQSVGFFQEEYSGGIATKVMQTALAVRDIVVAFLDIFAYVLVYFCSSAFVLFTFDSCLLLPFIVWSVMYFIACKYFLPRLTKVAKDQADARSQTTGRISDAYTNISTVKLFTHTNREARYVKDSMKEFMIPVHGQQRLVSGFDLTTYIMSMLLVFSTSSISVLLWFQGQVGPGVVAAATAMSLRFNGISQWAIWVLADFFEHIGTAQDGMKMLSQPITLDDAPDAKVLKVTSGKIHFENVDFSYGTEKNILKNFNLTISPDERVGLIGRSGSGKSTIINLLLRFYDVEGGRVLIDGQDTRSVTQDSLRSQIGMVTQDTSLLHRSIRDNILYGKPGLSDMEMISAAKKAEAHTFIDKLKDPLGRKGYDSHVGERGAKLSGGQRQRIAIARVILKNAPILLLDEATSALDSEVEAAIQNSLYTLMEGKTVVAIAHRLSTIAAMDRLVVLDQGRIVEEGSHKELLGQGGLYYQLWAHQSGGFLGDGSFEKLKSSA